VCTIYTHLTPDTGELTSIPSICYIANKVKVVQALSIGPHEAFYTLVTCEKILTRTRIDLPHTVSVLRVYKFIS